MSLVLSVFPGIGMLDHAFELEGFCIVRGPDLLWGGDVRTFHPPAGVFRGVIGGPPCQAFSALRHLVEANGYEPRFGNLIPEFERVVAEAQPDWFIMENVPAAPTPAVEGDQVHAQLLDNRWLGEEQQRKRRISFGTRDGRKLHIEYAALMAPERYVAVNADPSLRALERGEVYVCTQAAADRGSLDTTPVKIGGSGKLKRSVPAVVHSGHGGGERPKTVRYTLADACRLQGLPENFLKDAPFTAQGKLQVIANGVPIPMGRAIARAVKRAMEAEQ